ncbi:UNVERIFIED_CONTAM: Retrovirus-related Pol polyprotein from transposon RE2 [Sesamum latifolium]|uniref:Retrovirus-related Pol polyprotein from transposon RE2 n=1 Tax=Sesamum latifolium TaxID=2727402 RepID=A0AAW2WSK4_9LAMI
MVYAVEKQQAVHTDLGNNFNHSAYQLAVNTDKKGGAKPVQERKAFVDKRNLMCTHCHKKGHTRDTCFQLHGVPDWYKTLDDKKKKGKSFAANIDITNEGSDKAPSHNVVEIVAKVLKRMQKNDVPSDPLSHYANYAQFDDDFAVSQMCRQANCQLLFTQRGCVLQDQNVTCSTSVPCSSSKWHNHLGHASAQFDKGIKVIRSDNSLEFINQECRMICETLGIVHQTSCTYTPQQNGLLSEFRIGRFLMKNFMEAFLNTITCELLALYVMLLIFILNDLSFKAGALNCVLIGYSMHQKAYKLFDLDNKSVFFFRDVQFYEDIFPFADVQPGHSTTEPELNSYVEAVKYVEWQDAMKVELDALERNYGLLALLMYVDDILVTAATVTLIQQKAGVHVVRYPKGTATKGLFLPSDSSFKLRAYCDADWVSCTDSRRSLTGFCVFFGNALISWKTKKQSTVSRSTAKAEYMSMAATVCELHWLSYLLLDLGVSLRLPIKLFCDNQAAMHIMANPMFLVRTKHIELDCHIVQGAYKDGFISPSFVHSSLQIADIFTKTLGLKSFVSLLGKSWVWLLCTPVPLVGGMLSFYILMRLPLILSSKKV